MRKPVKSAMSEAPGGPADSPEAKMDAHGLAAIKRKRGGHVSGDKPKHRMDRPAFARGGGVKGKGKTTVNVIIAPQGGGGAGPGAVSPHPPMPMPPPGAMPPGGASGPMAGPPGAGMPPQPMMRKNGGRVNFPGMKAGAMSGEGRMEKVKAYGKNARSGEGK